MRERASAGTWSIATLRETVTIAFPNEPSPGERKSMPGERFYELFEAEAKGVQRALMARPELAWILPYCGDSARVRRPAGPAGGAQRATGRDRWLPAP